MSNLFLKYNSLVNVDNGKFVRSMINQGLHIGEWVLTEKIHGCNYAYYCDGDTVWNASRTQVIPEGSNFKGSANVIKYNQAVLDVFERLCDNGMVEHGDTVIIYGELFGGSFFGERLEGCNLVQRGMDYHPGNEFCAFDVTIVPELEDDVHYNLSFEERIDALTGLIPMVPVLARGSLEDMLKVDNDFNSKVPELFGLSIPEGEYSQSEGWVCEPVKSGVYKGESRCILKSRNSKFKEKSNKPAKSAKPPLVLSDEESEMYQEFSLYLNLNRLESVISKVGDVEWKMFGMLSGLLMKDAIEAYSEDNECNLRDSDVWSAIRKPLGNVSGDIVRKYLKDNLEVC